MSTKLELRTAIKQEARVKTGTNLDDMIDTIMDDVLTDYCNLSRYYELLVEGTALTLVDGQQAYDLPVDFQHLDVLRYGRGPATVPTSFREIKLQTGIIRQTYNGGYPMYFRLVGRKISLWPYQNIVMTDQLLLDYYANPLSLFSDDSDEFPVPRLQSAVKKDVISRIQRFSSALPEAQLMDADGRASFNAGQAADT